MLKKKKLCPQFFITSPICHNKKTLKWFLHDSPYANTTDSKVKCWTFSTAMLRADARKFFFFFLLLRVRSTKLVKESSNVKKKTSMKKWKCQARKKQRQFALFPHFASLHLKSGSRAHSRSVVLCWQSCPGRPIPTVPLWLSCPLSNVLTVLCWQSCSVCSDLLALFVLLSFWLSHYICPILAVPFWLSHLAVPFWLSQSDCPVLASIGCPVPAASFWQSSPGCLILPFVCW